ncbi:MAG: transposase [Cyclobacteriaceae bacterium]
MNLASEHPQFITITVHEWKNLLKPKKYKNIILDSLSFLVKEQRSSIYAFVILDNHIHLIWQIIEPNKRTDVQRDFLKYVAQQIKFDLIDNHLEVLEHFKVDKKDRQYQFWKRDALSIDLYSEKVFNQKLDYIHDNPVKAGFCEKPEDYFYSSASYYLLNDKNFSFLSHHDS